MKVREGFVVKTVGMKKYAVATGAAAQSFKGMLCLNEVGADIFTLLQEDTTVEAIVDSICNDYDVPSEIATKDVHNFIAQLRSINVIVD